MDRLQLEQLFSEHGFADYKWMNGQDIRVAQWVRMKCVYGCNSYGKSSTCPPNAPSVPECRRFFDEYDQAALFHFAEQFDNPEQLRAWLKNTNQRLSKLEKDVFLAGFHKAFMLFVDECNFCSECVAERSECKNKRAARPSVEAMAVDVYGTARSVGYPIQVIRNPDETTNRYALLLVE